MRRRLKLLKQPRIVISKSSKASYIVLVDDIKLTKYIQTHLKEHPSSLYLMPRFIYCNLFQLDFQDLIADGDKVKNIFKARGFMLSEKQVTLLKEVVKKYGQQIVIVESGEEDTRRRKKRGVQNKGAKTQTKKRNIKDKEHNVKAENTA